MYLNILENLTEDMIKRIKEIDCLRMGSYQLFEVAALMSSWLQCLFCLPFGYKATVYMVGLSLILSE